MDIINEKVVDGVVCRRFDLAVEGQVVPGLQWWPEGGTGPRPTILMGHGGFQSKEAPNIVAMAERFARERGFATVALDAPGHGDRRTEEQIRRQEDTLRRLRRDGAGGDGGRAPRARTDDSSPTPAPTPTPTPAASPEREPRMVREWKALLDELEGEPASAG